jgi:hypothetical protein
MGVPREAPERRLRALRVPRLSDRPVLRLSDRRDLRLSDRRDPRLLDRQVPRLLDRQVPRLSARQDPRLTDRQDLRLLDRQVPRLSARQDLRLSAPPQIAAIQGAAIQGATPARAPHRLGAPAARARAQAQAQAQREAVPLEPPVRPSAERRSSASVFLSTGSRSRPITNRHATTCGSLSTIPTRSSLRRRVLGEALE